MTDFSNWRSVRSATIVNIPPLFIWKIVLKQCKEMLKVILFHINQITVPKWKDNRNIYTQNKTLDMSILIEKGASVMSCRRSRAAEPRLDATLLGFPPITAFSDQTTKAVIKCLQTWKLSAVLHRPADHEMSPKEAISVPSLKTIFSQMNLELLINANWLPPCLDDHLRFSRRIPMVVRSVQRSLSHV